MKKKKGAAKSGNPNTRGLATKADIRRLETQIRKLGGRASRHESAIGFNKSGIEKNTVSIEKNRVAIDKNREAIDKNREAIDKNREAIDKNREAIDKNREAIDKNRVAIDKNRVSIDRLAIEQAKMRGEMRDMEIRLSERIDNGVSRILEVAGHNSDKVTTLDRRQIITSHRVDALETRVGDLERRPPAH